jgi:hypothetical protein
VTTDKLRVLVPVDLDCTKAQVAAQGHVTSESVHGLYAVMKRANSLTAGMALELYMTRARIEPDALEELRACSRSHHLPTRVDPLQSDNTLSILTPDTAVPLAALATQAARPAATNLPHFPDSIFIAILPGQARLGSDRTSALSEWNRRQL